MIWLIGVVLILQACFYWVMKPLIGIATPIVELRSLAFLLLLLVAWLVSGRVENHHPPSS